MTNDDDMLLDDAEQEYRELGTLSCDTYMLLSGAGFNPESLMDEWGQVL